MMVRSGVDLQLILRIQNAWKLPLDSIRAAPWTRQITTNSKQNAKNGARRASFAANPANLSKNPIRSRPRSA